MENTMKAARMHKVGEPMIVEEIPLPALGSTDVLVRVKACGMVPNLANILANWPKWCPHLPLPKLPAVFGLDPSGVVAEVGEQVIGIKPGDRVYVNPGRSCGTCDMCLKNERTRCRYFTFNGYFGFQAASQELFSMYPFGGFSEYMSAPQYSIVKLSDNISFEQAARLGYVGTGYSALKKLGHLAGSTLLINGISGTLGLGTLISALGLGATRIYGTGRDQRLLDLVKALAPRRIEVFSTKDSNKTITEWIREQTNGDGVDFMVDTLGPGTPLSVLEEGIKSVRRGGKIINIGGTVGEIAIEVKWLMDEQIQLLGSVWFSSAEGREMVEMARAGTLDLSIFHHEAHPLSEINEALEKIKARNGGFDNFVITP